MTTCTLRGIMTPHRLSHSWMLPGGLIRCMNNNASKPVHADPQAALASGSRMRGSDAAACQAVHTRPGQKNLIGSPAVDHIWTNRCCSNSTRSSSSICFNSGCISSGCLVGSRAGCRWGARSVPHISHAEPVWFGLSKVQVAQLHISPIRRKTVGNPASIKPWCRQCQ